MGCQDISFGHGTIQSFLAGILQYNAPGCPSNLSIFGFFEKLRDGSKNKNKLLLWVMQKDGKQDQKRICIQKPLKQVVVAPSSYNDTKDQLSINIRLLSILFGKNSLLHRGVTRFPWWGRSYNIDCTVDRRLLARRICPRTYERPILKDRRFIDLFKCCLSNKV